MPFSRGGAGDTLGPQQGQNETVNTVPKFFPIHSQALFLGLTLVRAQGLTSAQGHDYFTESDATQGSHSNRTQNPAVNPLFHLFSALTFLTTVTPLVI